MTDSLRVVTLLARHGSERYPAALDRLAALFAPLTDVDHRTVVIDNAGPSGSAEDLGAGVELIGSDNRSWEFSAWDDGVAYLGRRLDDFDVVHLATSAFGELYVDHLDRFDHAALRVAALRAVALGHVDCYNDPVQLFGVTSQAWLRSSYVFLAPRELRLLGSLVAPEDLDACFGAEPGTPFRDDAPLSPELRDNILGWLTGPGTGQGVEWHSRFELGPDTMARFRAKAAAILHEQLLTIRLQTIGCRPLDITWLTGLAAGDVALEDGGTIPPLAMQLAGRPVDTIGSLG